MNKGRRRLVAVGVVIVIAALGLFAYAAFGRGGPTHALTTDISCVGGRPVDCAYGNLRYANLAGGNLAGANFTGADLRNVNFDSADLANATFVNANLANTNFSNADLTGANLTGTNYRSAIYCGTIMPDGTVDDGECSS